MSTRGLIHNQSPFLDEKVIPSFDGTPERSVPILRFYFDGLMAHVHLSENDPVERMGRMAVGAHNELVITTVTYEQSFQQDNVLWLMAEAALHPFEHPMRPKSPAARKGTD